MIVVALVATGCASTRVDRGPESGPSVAAPLEPRTPEEVVLVDARLRDEVARWRGTPYRLGGSSTSGIDCSAFVQRVYDAVFAVGLPRTTRSQVRVGRSVDLDELQPGDLVFFRPPSSPRHVGIYLSGGRFAHASTSEGVTISELSLPYWRRAYWTARRVVDDLPMHASVPRVLESATLDGPQPEATPPPSKRDGRVGW